MTYIIVNRGIDNRFVFCVVKDGSVTSRRFVLKYNTCTCGGFFASVVEGATLVAEHQVPIAEGRGEVRKITEKFLGITLGKINGILVDRTANFRADKLLAELLVNKTQALEMVAGIPMVGNAPNAVFNLFACSR